jgi:hypothetical protein
MTTSYKEPVARFVLGFMTGQNVSPLIKNLIVMGLDRMSEAEAMRAFTMADQIITEFKNRIASRDNAYTESPSLELKL